MNESFEEFLYLNKLYGLDELVQAGGGNISIKHAVNSNTIIIKSSGFNFHDVTQHDGFAILKLINYDELINCNYDLTNLIISGKNPSIETYFHLFLKKYTVHLHPTLINIYMCSNRELPILNTPYVIIDYFKPGVNLSNEIYKKYNGENIIFLKNHGVVFTSDNLDELKQLIYECYNKFIDNSNTQHIFTDLQSYEELIKLYPNKILLKLTTQYKKQNIVAYTPDIVVYLNDSIIEYNNDVYIASVSKYKCYQILEVLNSYNCIHNNQCNLVLSCEQQHELLNWDREKIRINKL